MDAEQRNRLVEVMGRMAGGDAAAAITLYREFGNAVRSKVARIARSQGATHLTQDDIDAMALDVCFDLFERAGSWDPDGGALPWVWAERRIVGIVARQIGQYGATFDESAPPEHGPGDGGVAFAGDDLGGDEALDRLAASSELCALLRDALGTLSARNRAVFLDFLLQRGSGDPSPSHTVAAQFGLSPDNVRQIVRRVRVRLLEVVAADPRFAPLAGLPLLGEGEAA